MDQAKSLTDLLMFALARLLLLDLRTLVVVQDDANFVALINLETMRVVCVALPSDKHGKLLFDDKRGTKKEKMDLEACVLDDNGRIVLFGYGSSTKRAYCGCYSWR
jgi:hypothetical protein